MKNSPGSMIGGMGFTTRVRDLQVARIRPRTSSTLSSSTPTMMVTLAWRRKPPDDDRRVARCPRSSRAPSSAPVSSLCTMATTSFTARV